MDVYNAQFWESFGCNLTLLSVFLACQISMEAKIGHNKLNFNMKVSKSQSIKGTTLMFKFFITPMGFFKPIKGPCRSSVDLQSHSQVALHLSQYVESNLTRSRAARLNRDSLAGGLSRRKSVCNHWIMSWKVSSQSYSSLNPKERLDFHRYYVSGGWMDG